MNATCSLLTRCSFLTWDTVRGDGFLLLWEVAKSTRPLNLKMPSVHLKPIKGIPKASLNFKAWEGWGSPMGLPGKHTSFQICLKFHFLIKIFLSLSSVPGRTLRVKCKVYESRAFPFLSTLLSRAGYMVWHTVGAQKICWSNKQTDLGNCPILCAYYS